MSKVNDFLKNHIKTNNQKYSLIIGLTPSQGARSPKIWNKVYKKIKSKCRMYPADVELKDLKNLLRYLKKDKNFLGGSVTTPYKNHIIKYLDNLNQDAKKIGSVNTLVKKNKKLIGCNTDFYGALSTIKKIKLKKNILVFGAGGASKAVILALQSRYSKSKFYFFNRNKNKLNFLKKNSFKKKIKILDNINDIKSIDKLDLIVNTTSVGFNSWIKSKKNYFNLKFFSPITKISNLNLINEKDTKRFTSKNYKLILKDKKNLETFFKKNKKLVVYDIIYSPQKTKLLKYAEKYRNKVYNGLEMNLMQAVKGFMLVNNIKGLNKVKLKMIK